MNYHYIDDDAGLETLLRACESAPVIALDTEFARFNTYYPMIGLLQIGLGHDNYLLDPLPITDLSGLQALMKCPDTLKVVHSGSEDMEVFQYWLDCVPTPIFDTQIAAAMVGIGYALSYQKLVAHFLSIDIPKGETRSDWLARPLRQSQLDYAAQDVIHLFEIYPMLAELLAEKDRIEWVLSESFKLTQDLPTKIDPDEAYLKLKGISSLNSRQLQYLRMFCAFREREAQTRNVPRNRVLDNDELIALALNEVQGVADMKGVDWVDRRAVSRHGDALAALGMAASVVPTAELPARLVNDTTPVNKNKLDRLRRVVADRAKQFGISPELLSRRRDLEAIIKSDNQGGAMLPDHLLGWREAVVGIPLLAAIGQS
mgnify:FL=1